MEAGIELATLQPSEYPTEKKIERHRKTHRQRIVTTGNRRAQRKRQRQAKAKGRK